MLCSFVSGISRVYAVRETKEGNLMELAHLMGLALAGLCGGVCIGVVGLCVFSFGYFLYRGAKALSK